MHDANRIARMNWAAVGWRSVAVAAVVMWSLAACGASGGGGESGSSATTETAETTETTAPSPRGHQRDLAQGETPGIASQLVDVPGYTYVDAPADEIEATIDTLRSHAEEAGDPDFFRAFSFHSVVADDDSQNVSRTASGGLETGYLVIIEFTDPPPAGSAGEVARAGMQGSDEIDSFTVAGTEVVVFETADSVDSRYTLAWSRHGTQTRFDGAERAPLERWARAYLEIPEHQPDETDALTAALDEVRGYDYVNHWDEEFSDSLEPMVGEGDSSVHVVADETGGVGVLVLVDQGGDRTPERLEAIAEELNPGGETLRMALGDTVVVQTKAKTGETVHLWSRDGIVGLYFAPKDTNALGFVMPYLVDL